MLSRVIRFVVPLLSIVLILTGAKAQTPVESTMPTNAEIRKILIDRIGAENQGIGYVVGVIDANGRRIVACGSSAKDDKRPFDGDSIFEIGSITKVFTSLVLMDMVQKGEVAVTDPVAKFLPAGVKVPERNGKKITLQDLATQSSGLPRMPTNFKPQDSTNPFNDYSPALLYEFLSSYSLPRDIGEKFEYSNLGVGLLGHALSLSAGLDYETLVKARVLDPLGMVHTAVTFTPEMKAHLAVGHGGNLEPVANWDLNVLAGAGALRSSANDMLTFLAANLGYIKTPLAAAMNEEISIRRPAGAGGMEIAYNWFIQTKEGKSIIWHNGGTGGYRSYIGFDPKLKMGVVVLSNFSPANPEDIGRHLLDPSYPLGKMEAPKKHVEVAVDKNVLKRYVGAYQLAPNMVITMSLEGDQLSSQLTGQSKYPVFAESPTTFFLKVVDAQFSFEADAEGPAPQVTLHQGGKDHVAKRVDESQATAVQAALAKRVKDQLPAPGSEAALRRDIEELRQGKPNYALMSTGLADVTRQQLPRLTDMIGQLGAVESVTFKGVGPGGADIYEVKCEHGATEWRIAMETEEKIAAARVRKLDQ